MAKPNKLIHPRDFDREFTALISLPGYTHQQAFDELNDIYETEFNKPRYSDYNSYRVARRKRLQAWAKNHTPIANRQQLKANRHAIASAAPASAYATK